MSDSEETPTTRDTTPSASATSQRNIREQFCTKNCEAPKLKSDECSEYEVWRNHITWWQMLTRIPKYRQAPYVNLNANQVRSLHQMIQEISQAEAGTDERLDIVLKNLDRHFMPNTFTSLQSWMEQKT